MVQKIKHENEISWDVETDVAVVGGGACGLIASLAAAERGVEIMLFEKEKKVGGNTSLSQGMIPAAGTRFQKAVGIDDSPELMAEDIFKKNNYESDPEMTLHLCRESRNLVEWLVDSVGIHLDILDIVTDFIYPGHSRHRIHAPSTRKGTQIVNELRAAISNRKDILLVQQAPVRDLIATEADGGVIGLEVEIFGQGINRVRARKVILACNGFGNNKERQINGRTHFIEKSHLSENLFLEEFEHKVIDRRYFYYSMLVYHQELRAFYKQLINKPIRR
jgi:fumarate reductase flavoprotein subunit